jgi:hypothetical protein
VDTKHPWRKNVALAVVPLVGISASVALFFLARDWEHERIRADYASRANDRLLSVRAAVGEHLAVI